MCVYNAVYALIIGLISENLKGYIMNKTIKKTTIFILILAMLLAFTACGGDDATLATIKDTKITEGQLDSYASYYSLLSLSTPFKELGENEQAYLKGVILNFAVEVDLLKEHYKEEGVKILPDDYDDQFKKYKETLFSQSEDMQSQLSNAGIDNDTLEFFYSAQFYTKQFMEDIDKEDPVSDDEIEKYYNEHKEEFVSPAQIKVSHILVKDEEHTDAGKTSIEAIKTKIDKGASFSDTAKKYSEDGSASNGGDLGWINKDTSFVQEFKDAAFALKKGEMSGVVESEFGYHLIKVTDTEKEHQKTYKESKDEVKALLEEENYAAGIESLKKEIGVEYTKEGEEILKDSESGSGITAQ